MSQSGELAKGQAGGGYRILTVEQRLETVLDATYLPATVEKLWQDGWRVISVTTLPPGPLDMGRPAIYVLAERG